MGNHVSLQLGGGDPSGTWTLSLVDEVPGILSDCVDFPFSQTVTYTDSTSFETFQAIVGCKHFRDGECVGEAPVPKVLDAFLQQTNASAFVDDETGRSVEDSCCLCGGGLTVSPTRENTLVSWRLNVYGHTDPMLPDPPEIFDRPVVLSSRQQP